MIPRAFRVEHILATTHAVFNSARLKMLTNLHKSTHQRTFERTLCRYDSTAAYDVVTVNIRIC